MCNDAACRGRSSRSLDAVRLACGPRIRIRSGIGSEMRAVVLAAPSRRIDARRAVLHAAARAPEERCKRYATERNETDCACARCALRASRRCADLVVQLDEIPGRSLAADAGRRSGCAARAAPCPRPAGNPVRSPRRSTRSESRYSSQRATRRQRSAMLFAMRGNFRASAMGRTSAGNPASQRAAASARTGTVCAVRSTTFLRTSTSLGRSSSSRARRKRRPFELQ